jgi:hypothetical protein
LLAEEVDSLRSLPEKPYKWLAETFGLQVPDREAED